MGAFLQGLVAWVDAQPEPTDVFYAWSGALFVLVVLSYRRRPS